MNVRLSGPWSMDQVQQHLEHTVIPIRLGCLGPADGPRLLSLWFVHRESALWCATKDDADVTRFLHKDSRCAFEIARDEPPYRGVRGWGTASIVPERGAEILRLLLERYQGGTDTSLGKWLLSQADREVALRIEPERLVTWDFTERMQEGT